MPLPDSNLTAWQVLRGLVCHPYARVWRRWNWKSALLSSIIRASIFFATNLRVGFDAAIGAATAELIFRACTSGFYGAITEAFVPVRPPAVAMVSTMVLLPTLAHLMEFVVHSIRGTPELARSMAASIAFTSVSTAFTLFAMQRGALITGEGRRSIGSDLLCMPALIIAFIRTLVRVRYRLPWRRCS